MDRGIEKQNPTGSSADISGVLPTPKQSGRVSEAKYVTSILVLIVLSVSIFLFIPPLSILAVVFLATAFGLVPTLVAAVYARKRQGTAVFLRSFASQSVFALVFMFGLTSLRYGGSDFALVVQPILVFTNAILLWRVGGMLTRSGAAVLGGMTLNRLGVALLLFSIFQLIALWIVLVGYPFLYAAIAYGVLSISPLVAFSNRFKSFKAAGEYLVHSSERWTAVAFLLGIAAAILSFPGANIYSYVVVLILSAIGLTYVGLRIYSLGSTRLQSIREDLYRKHQHEVSLVSDESFDYLRAAIAEFVRAGLKGDLTIALTNLMTNAGMDYSQIRGDLVPLSSYDLPNVFKFSYLGLKKSMELEMQRRIGIVQVLMTSISAEASARGKR